jgi:pimeloyl-ACP methyl ester carboxylesterase
MRLALVILLLILIVGGGALYILYRNDITAARALIEGKSKTVETSFGTIEYAEAGSGSPILVIHGAGGGFDQGMDEAGVWAANHRVIAPSRFGYLGSAFPQRATSAMQADAFVALLDSLGIDKVGVLGISAGANSAMALAIHHPDRVTSLALMVPAAYAPSRKPPPPGGSAYEGIIRRVLGSDFIFWLGVRFLPNTMTGTLLATDPALLRSATASEKQRASALLWHILPVSVRTDGLMFDATLVSDLTTPPELDKVVCPVLAISAKDDRYDTAETAQYVVDHVTNGRAIIFETGGHLLIGHNDEVVNLIRNFFGG